MQRISSRLMAAIISAIGAGVQHSGVPLSVMDELRRPVQNGYEHVLARRGANPRHSKAWRARRLNQASAHARARLGV